MCRHCVPNDTPKSQRIQDGLFSLIDQASREMISRGLSGVAASPDDIAESCCDPNSSKRSFSASSSTDLELFPSVYLELKDNSVEEQKEHAPGAEPVEQEEWIHECRAVGCRSRFCKCCCRKLGNKLRRDLTPALVKFSAITMLTLTIDPKLFSSPEEAYWYVRDKRSIFHLVKRLSESGQLNSRRFFCVVEWHKNGWPHFHVLVESSFITFKSLAQAWGKNRPASAPKWEGDYNDSIKGLSPEFGTVHITNRASDFKSAEHAANYALKYVTKQPEQGFPDWVLDSQRQIRIYQTSRYLLKEKPTTPKKRITSGKVVTPETPHDSECFCESCRGNSTEQLRQRKRSGISIRQRLEQCGVDAVIFRYQMVSDGQGGEKQGSRQFVRGLAITFAKALELLDCSEMKTRAVNLRSGDLLKLATHRRMQQSVVGGGVNPSDTARHTAFDHWNEQALGT